MTVGMLHLRRLSRGMAVFGMGAWLTGSLWALVTFNPTIFERFGALGVAAAVLLFTDQLDRIELERQRGVERVLNEFGAELEMLKSGVDAEDLPEHGVVTDFHAESAHFGELRARADKINSLNVLLLTLSTLQWGFGDLFLLKYFAPVVGG